METLTVETPAMVEVTDWKADFGAWLDENVMSQHTRKAYLSDMTIYANWYEGANNEPFQPPFLTNVDLKLYRKWSDDVSPATWNRRRASLRVFFGWARMQGYIQHSVDIFANVKTKNMGQPEPKWLSNSECRKMERHIENRLNGAKTHYQKWLWRRNQAIFRMMVYGGLREFEVCGLRVTDVTIRDRSGVVEVRHGKGDKYRRVPLIMDVRETVTAWMDVRGQVESDVLFLNKDGGAIGVNAIQEMVNSVAVACGLGRVTAHQLRHTFCHEALLKMIGKGEGDHALAAVARLAGHSRTDTTAKYITRSDDELLSLLED